MKRFTPIFLLTFLALMSISCMAVSRVLLEPTPTPQPTATAVPPSLTPSPSPTITPTPDYCPNGDCISACMEHLPTIARPGAAGGGMKSSHRSEGGGEGFILVTYTVIGDKILSPQDITGIPKADQVYQDDRASQQKIWDYFAAIIPLEQRRFLNEFNIFTDGSSNILAFVSQSDSDMGKWLLSVDMADAADPKDLTYTLVHEFGHLLTLNSSQVVPSRVVFDNPHSDDIYQQEVDACQTYFAGEGCSKPDAYVNQFFERFWPDIYAEWQTIDDTENEHAYYVALQDFYEKYKDQFVTDYAPTNPVEDLAESFSFFMLKPKPTGDTIADQKVLFFYEYPELLSLRSQVARRLCDQLNK